MTTARASASTVTSSSAGVLTTSVTIPHRPACSPVNARAVRTMSLVRIGPISRTRRGSVAHGIGMARCASGSDSTASATTTCRSHARASTTPPPRARPWTRAIVSARMAVTAFIACLPRSMLASIDPSSGAGPGSKASNPLQNARPADSTTTTRTSSRSSNQRAASTSPPSSG